MLEAYYSKITCELRASYVEIMCELRAYYLRIIACVLDLQSNTHRTVFGDFANSQISEDKTVTKNELEMLFDLSESLQIPRAYVRGIFIEEEIISK